MNLNDLSKEEEGMRGSECFAVTTETNMREAGICCKKGDFISIM